jgi:PIN domain nuclease of toxin-antitoxin system
MRLLLDSHVFLWWLQDSRRLGRAARRAIQAPTATVFVSAASVWEIAIKQSIGRLRMGSGRSAALDSAISACGFVELPVTARHAASVRELPHHHGDPFDRLLVAQARVEGSYLVTADDQFAPYGVPLVPAYD